MRTIQYRAGFSHTVQFWGLFSLFAMTAVLFLFVGNEREIADWFGSVRALSPRLTGVMSALSQYGNLMFYAIYVYILVRSFGSGDRAGCHFILYYLMMLVLLLLVTDTLKIWIGRPRPGEAGEYVLLSLHKRWHSFPSNHMTETAFSVLALAQFFKRRPYTAVFSLWVLVMGVTRLYLGRHHPTDLLGSALLGSLGVYVLWKLAETWFTAPAVRQCPQAG